MRCSKALAALFDRENGVLAAREAVALERHLERCPACAAEAERGPGLVLALASLRADPPFEVDVRARVCRTIAMRPWISADEPTRRELGWSVAAALAACAAIAVGLGDSLPALRVVAEWTVVLKSALAPLAELCASLGSTALGLIVRGVGALVAAAPDAARLSPVLAFLGSLSASAMAATIGFVLARDVRRAQRFQRG